MYDTNYIGPRMVLCGVPDTTGAHSKKVPLTTTPCLWQVRKCLSQFLDARIASKMPVLFSSDNGRLCAALYVPVTNLAVCNTFTSCLFLNVLVFFKHWLFIASRQFASQAFIFSLNEAGTTHCHYAVRCQQWLSTFSSGILAPLGCAPFGQHQKERGIWGRECMLVTGENSVWQMGEYVFLWHLLDPARLNQLFCNLHDL